jgi:hypothetical protein
LNKNVSENGINNKRKERTRLANDVTNLRLSVQQMVAVFIFIPVDDPSMAKV